MQRSLQPPPAVHTPRSSSPTSGTSKGIVIFSGGSAANSLVDVFNDIAKQQASPLSYVIPISDNGGSTSELIRVFGGPGIGDLRSRLVRLIPDSRPGEPASEVAAIKEFFNHRLPPDSTEARSEWLDIVEADHDLWTNISAPRKELIRSFLNVVNLEIVKRLRPSSRFDYSRASIGNLFLTGARLFTGSLEAAIYLLSSICSVPSSISVLPVINSNFSHHISASLANGEIITGQNNISHPSESSAPLPGNVPSSPSRLRSETEEQDRIEDANLPGTLPTLRKPAINFSKVDSDGDDLPARISRLWYINPYGQEIRLPANPRVVDALASCSSIIFSIGSLFTSLVPSLVLKHVGNAVANPAIRSKILILNGTNDRETGPSTDPYDALDFVGAIANACAESQETDAPSPAEYWRFVTHVIYLESSSSPKVDREVLAKAGIESIRIYGRRTANGEARYDADALRGALGMVLGRADLRTSGSRRNTLER